MRGNTGLGTLTLSLTGWWHAPCHPNRHPSQRYRFRRLVALALAALLDSTKKVASSDADGTRFLLPSDPLTSRV